MGRQYEDENNNIAPVFHRRDELAHNESLTAGTAALIAFDPETQIVSFWAEGTVFLKFGDDSVEATVDDHALPAGIIDYEPLTDEKRKIVKTHVSVLAPADTVFHLSERD